MIFLKPDIVFFALLLAFSDILQQSTFLTLANKSNQDFIITITIPIYGEMYNNRQCDNRLLFIKFALTFISNYIQKNFQNHCHKCDYLITITPAHQFTFTLNVNLSTNLIIMFNVHHNISWISDLSSENKQWFSKYFLLFMAFNNSKNIYAAGKEYMTSVNIIYNNIYRYYSKLNYLEYITDTVNLGKNKYGFKVDINRVITNNLLANLCRLDNLFASSQDVLFPEHLEYCINYIKSTYTYYRDSVLAAKDIYSLDMENDVFI